MISSYTNTLPTSSLRSTSSLRTPSQRSARRGAWRWHYVVALCSLYIYASHKYYYHQGEFVVMDILFLSAICALSYIIILCKIFSLKFLAKTQVIWDVIFTFGMPLLFVGTFSGMSTAFISGVMFSCMTYFLSLLTKDSLLQRLYHGKKDSENNNSNTCPPRSGRCPLCNKTGNVQGL